MDSVVPLTKMQELYKQNPALYKARNSASYRKHRDARLEKGKQDYQKNRERRLKQCVQWNKTHPDNLSRAQKKWRAANPNYHQEWEERNREKLNAQRRNLYAKNIEASRKKKKNWRERNRHLYRMYIAKYFALKRAATVNLRGIKHWMDEIKRKKTIPCYYCQRIVLTDKIHFDHIIALSNGGSHSIDNLCVSCSFCNQSKSAKPIRTWIRMGQQILEL